MRHKRYKKAHFSGGLWSVAKTVFFETERWCMAGLPPVPMHGVKNALLLPIRFTDARRQRRADRLRKVGEVSRGVKKNAIFEITLYTL